MIEDYFGPIKNKAPKNKREVIVEDPITSTRYATEYDANIQIPAKIFSYVTPKSIDRDAYVIDYISAVLTGGASSRMQVRMVDEEQIALNVLAFGQANQDYGTYTMGALSKGDVELSKLAEVMDEEIVKLQTELISEREYQKLQNNFEAQYVSSNSRVEGIAASLARYNMLMGDTSLINKELDVYRSITREDIKRVANEYLKPNQRLELDYLAGSAPTEEEIEAAVTEVEVVDNKLQINKIYFDSDKATITASAGNELDRIAKMMMKNPTMEILAETYTDTKGSDVYNTTLSQNRADAVRGYIIAKGIDSNRIKAVGRGEDNPVIDCESKKCSDEELEQSRRTEFTITKK
jgi:outer membrane protein OmpA-like peptidoglycan-associated protein